MLSHYIKNHWDFCCWYNYGFLWLFQSRCREGSLVFKHEGQKGQTTGCEWDFCLWKVGNGKVGITIFGVKRSGERYSTWARMKTTMSRKIKPFPVKASGPEYHRVVLSRGYTPQAGGAFECIPRDRHRSTLWASSSSLLGGDPKDLEVLKANTSVCFHGLEQGRHQNDI